MQRGICGVGRYVVPDNIVVVLQSFTQTNMEFVFPWFSFDTWFTQFFRVEDAIRREAAKAAEQQIFSQQWLGSKIDSGGWGNKAGPSNYPPGPPDGR